MADPLAEPDVCKRDIEKFKELGLNTIRVYHVDNSMDHDECMDAMAEAGIYLLLDINTPLYSLNRDEPRKSYNEVYLQNVFATIDMFSKYDNVLGFFSGNEVIDFPETAPAAPFVKAVTRDIRQYIGTRGYRKIPVGYSAVDDETNREQMAKYLNCGTDDERSDFFAFNDYSWCDPSSFTLSGWDQKVENYSSYSIPLLYVKPTPETWLPRRRRFLTWSCSLSEYGCIKNERKFGEVASLYSEDMSAVFSGGLVYEYSLEENGYGLVKIEGDSIEELDDFGALKEAFANQEDPTGDGGYKSDGEASECPAMIGDWEVESETLPALPVKAMKLYDDGAGEGVGMEGLGSQEAGTASEGDAEPGSGIVTSTASPTGAAAAVRVPDMAVASMVSTFVLMLSALFGAALL